MWRRAIPDSPIWRVITQKLTPSKICDRIAAAHGAARCRWRLEGVKHFILRQYRVASVSQPGASRRSASIKFWQNCTIFAVSARQLCQTQRKCEHHVENTLFDVSFISTRFSDEPIYVKPKKRRSAKIDRCRCAFFHTENAREMT